jgi:hypothetical protein
MIEIAAQLFPGLCVLIVGPVGDYRRERLTKTTAEARSLDPSVDCNGHAAPRDPGEHMRNRYGQAATN